MYHIWGRNSVLSIEDGWVELWFARKEWGKEVCFVFVITQGGRRIVRSQSLVQFVSIRYSWRQSESEAYMRLSKAMGRLVKVRWRKYRFVFLRLSKELEKLSSWRCRSKSVALEGSRVITRRCEERKLSLGWYAFKVIERSRSKRDWSNFVPVRGARLRLECMLE